MNSMFKRGMSGVIATVLIILFSIVAVAVVGGIVLYQLNKAKLSMEDAQMCTELANTIKPVKCIYNEQTVKPAAVVIVFRGLSDNSAELVRVGTRVETLVGDVKSSVILGTDLPEGQSIMAPVFIESTDQLKNAIISPVFKGPSGREVVCQQYNSQVDCEKRGVLKNPGDPSLAVMTVSYSFDGKAISASFSFFDPRGGGYQSFGVQTLVQQSSGSGKATVYLSEVGAGGSIQEVYLIDGGSDWSGAPTVQAHVR